jgi:hypothetical protein
MYNREELVKKFEDVVFYTNEDVAVSACADIAEEYAASKWISTKTPPPMIEEKNYSENVFAILEGELAVMCFCYMPDDNGEWCYAWCNCYGQIDGDAEFDENYYPTLWMPMPTVPKITSKD